MPFLLLVSTFFLLWTSILSSIHTSVNSNYRPHLIILCRISVSHQISILCHIMSPTIYSDLDLDLDLKYAHSYSLTLTHTDTSTHSHTAIHLIYNNMTNSNSVVQYSIVQQSKMMRGSAVQCVRCVLCLSSLFHLSSTQNFKISKFIIQNREQKMIMRIE